MFEDITAGVVCILDAYGRPAGTGFVVSDNGFIVTCAHVLGISRLETVTLVFRATRERREARVIAEWWRSQDAEDVAVLQVDGNLPEAVRSLPLGSSGGTSGHKVSTFGFPEAGEVEGVHGVGEVAGTRSETRSGQHLLQLGSSEITTGFSGAPLWDEVRRRVIGMVVIVAKPDSSGKMGETAFATPTETLRAVCPALQLSEVCPYRNLEMFTEVDAEFFFGRQRVIDDLVSSLRSEPRFLAMFGPSGSGKSSVVQAGLIPQLRQGKVLGSDRWTVIVTRPTDPSFAQLLSLPDLSQHTRVVLVIDQFEELFVGSPETLRKDTVAQLASLLEGRLSITIIVVMRDDFYNRFAQQEVLQPWLRRGLVNVPSLLRRDELIAMVQEPAKAIGLRFEDGLVETIVQDAIVYDPAKAKGLRFKDGLVETVVQDAMETSKTHAGGGRVAYSTILPLLEFTLTKLWERREEGVLVREAYNTIGGVTGGLTQWADQVFYGLESEEKKKARRLFTSLVYLGEEDQGFHDSRRRMSLATLSRIKAVQQIVEELASKRLLVTAHDVQSKQDMVEIIHDALLWEWRLLREWLEEDRSFLIWHQELERRVRAWVETNESNPTRRDEYKLFGGLDLTEALVWLAKRAEDLSQDEQEFIQAGRKRQKRNERRRVIIGLGIAGLVAVAGASVAEPWLAMIWKRPPPHEQSLPLIVHHHTGPVNSAAWSPDGKLIASAGNDTTVQVWEPASGTTTRLTYRGHTGAVNSVAWSPDGKQIASAGNDTSVQVWDSTTGKPSVTYRSHTDFVNSVAWSPDGKLIASGSNDETVQVWDAASGITRLTYHGHASGVFSVAWSPDGKRIVSAGNNPGNNNTIQVWDVSTGALYFVYYEGADNIYSVAWSPDGRRIVSAGNDKLVQLWDATTGVTLLTYKHSNAVKSVAWSPDGKYIASAGNDKLVQLWDLTIGSTDTPFLAYQEHTDAVNSVAWSPDGKRIASASSDNMVQVSGAGITLVTYQGHADRVNSVVWLPDGKRIASGSDDTNVQVWNAATGVRSLSYKANAVRWSPDGRRIALVLGGIVQVWDFLTGELILTYQRHTVNVVAVMWSPDARHIASEDADRVVQVWDAVSGETVFTYYGHSIQGHCLAWSPDSRRIVSVSNEKTVQVLDATTGHGLVTYTGHTNLIYGAAWSPDGTRIASVGADSTVRVWDAANGRNAYTYKLHSQFTLAAAWSPDGTRIASCGFDSTVQVWDARIGSTLGNTLYVYHGHHRYVWDVSWSPDGTRIASAGAYDKTVRVWQAV